MCGIAGIVECDICLLQCPLRRITGLANCLLRSFLCFRNSAIGGTCGSRSSIGDSRLSFTNRAFCCVGRLLRSGIRGLLRLLHGSACSRTDTG